MISSLWSTRAGVKEVGHWIRLGDIEAMGRVWTGEGAWATPKTQVITIVVK